MRRHAAIKACLPAFALLAMSACGGGLGTYFAPTAAVVDGYKIPQGQISTQLAKVIHDPQFSSRFVGARGAHARLLAERQLLTQLVKEAAVVNEADRLHITVSSSEVTARLRAAVQDVYNSSEAALRKALARQGFTLEDARDYVRRQLLISKVVDRVTADASVSDQEVQDFYNENKEEFASMVHAAHILVCGNFDARSKTCAHTPEDEATANKVAQRAQSGEDFAALAKEFSVDTKNNASGGDLGWFKKGQYAPEFDKALDALAPGQISGVVRTPYGFHVFKMFAKGRPFDDAKAEIKNTLLSSRRLLAFQSWLSKDLGKAKVRVNPALGVFDPGSLTVVAGRHQQAPPPEVTSTGPA